MARAYRPSWDPCEEFRNKSQGSRLDFRENSASFKDIPTSKVKTVAKALRKELPQVKATWKSFLPNLSTKDVRRFRVPHHEVAILELEEAGYKDAAECMKMLFALDEEMRIKSGTGTIIWTNPRLKERVDFVDRLRVGLSEANRAMLEERQVAQVAALLETALYFQKLSWEWWWVAEQLFRSALKVSESVEDDYQTVTIVRYLYGRFMFNEMKDADGSLQLLNEARDASEEKPWNATKILGVKQDNLFRECCTLLYRVLLSLAKKAQGDDPDRAVQACQDALKHAMDSDHDEYIIEATCELGRSYLRANQAKSALQNFVKYLKLSREILNYEGICNAHMELAFAYKELGDAAKTMEQLELFRETASRFQLPHKLAQAHYHIGEHLLCRNHLSQATSHLEFSFTLYNGMGQTSEAHQARCIAAVSKGMCHCNVLSYYKSLSQNLLYIGQEFLDQFIEQIIRCGNCDGTATLKLCDWKNNRVPFWRTKIEEDESCGECPENGVFTKSGSHSYSDYETSSQSDIIEIQSLQDSSVNTISADLLVDTLN